ncbi:MAG: peptide chain release factor 1 [bacterium]
MDFSKQISELREQRKHFQSLLEKPETMQDTGLLRKYSKELSSLDRVLAVVDAYEIFFKQFSEAKKMAEEETDIELKAFAEIEYLELKVREEDERKKLMVALLPAEPEDEKDVIVEIRAGAGGDEAGLFAGELFRAYSKYAETVGWQVQVMGTSYNSVGGFKEIIFSISGDRVYSKMKFESGVHRVQRVPATEAGGRVHTSTITVAVLPEIEEVDFDLKMEDLKIDVYRASGPGGQGVNTTDSAVRVTHLPTGTVVTCQDGRSQIKNRERAISVLRSRMYQVEKERREQELGSKRKGQIGTGDRSEKIRTYNFPQDRITDHRVQITVHNLPGIMEGDLGRLFTPLIEAVQMQLLEEMVSGD